jgi:hypothetical protein
MPIITKSSPIAKDAPITFTLDKAALAALPVVVADAWFADDANWKKVILNYGSTLGNEMITVSFDATLATPTSSFLAISPSRDVFDIISITIQDFNQGTLRIPTSSLNQAEFVVDFNAAPVSLWDVFLAPTIATAGNGELHREGGSNGDVDNTAYYGNLVTGDFVFSGEVPTFSVGTSLFIGYRRTVPQAGLGYNSLFNTALNISNNSGFAQVEKLAGIGDTATNVGSVQLYNPATFSFSISRVSGVITATFNNVVRFTDNNSDPIYLMTSLPNLSGLMNSATLIETPIPVPNLLYVKDFSAPNYAADLSFNLGTGWVLDGNTAWIGNVNGSGGNNEMNFTNAAMLSSLVQGQSYKLRVYPASTTGNGYLGGSFKGGWIDQNQMQFTAPLPAYFEQIIVVGAGESLSLRADNINMSSYAISKIEIRNI